METWENIHAHTLTVTVHCTHAVPWCRTSIWSWHSIDTTGRASSRPASSVFVAGRPGCVRELQTLEVSILQHPLIIHLFALLLLLLLSSILCSGGGKEDRERERERERERDCWGGDRGDPETTRPTPEPDSQGTLIWRQVKPHASEDDDEEKGPRFFLSSLLLLLLLFFSFSSGGLDMSGAR